MFFVSARREDQRADTVKHLIATGYKDWDGLILKQPDDSAFCGAFKTVRARPSRRRTRSSPMWEISRATSPAVMPSGRSRYPTCLFCPLNVSKRRRRQFVRRSAITFEIRIFVEITRFLQAPGVGQGCRRRPRRTVKSGCLLHAVEATCAILKDVAGHVGAQERGNAWVKIDEGLSGEM